jgi:hypothetical protein
VVIPEVTSPDASRSREVMEMFQRNGELVDRGCDKSKGRGGNL